MDEKSYYVDREPGLLEQFGEDAANWEPVLVTRYGKVFAAVILQESRSEFEVLIPQIPYIGGEGALTGSLVKSARCLALYRLMKRHGKTAAETGKLLYDATLALSGQPRLSILSSRLLTPEQLTQRRKSRADWSQQRRFTEGYVYTYVPGDGKAFEYGYNFSECAAQKFYHAMGADEFLPLFCFLDYPESQVLGLGLERTKTLAEGHEICNHRFKQGRQTEWAWPPAFIRKE